MGTTQSRRWLELLFLGTGGAYSTPRVGCVCRVCEEARRKKGRFTRNGPSLFLPGPSLLFDTPEDIADSLEREGIHRVRRIIYTHWHPDHTMGRRVLEGLNMNILRPDVRRVTDVWLPTWVKEDFRKRLALFENFQFFERMGIVKVHEIGQGEPLHVDGVRVRAFRMAQPGLTAFLLQQGKKRVVLAVDDTKNWAPGDDLLEPDLLVIEAGWFERDPKGRVLVPKNHWVRGSEASFEDTLRLVERIKPSRTILTHIEELNSRSYADYVRLEREHKDKNLQFAYDGLRVLV
jgi:phosphoribosyl 1,2-cyclic phosphate phosphodiesterase